MPEVKLRYAVVTWANKGIGLETVNQLASSGVKVLLTARDEDRGHEAIERLKECGLSDLVNNAGISGVIPYEMEESTINWKELTQTCEMAEKCLTTNYYGAKETTEAFLPLLQLSNSPRIVNVSSQAGLLKGIANELVKGVFDDAENLTEERIDEVLKVYQRLKRRLT
ncbi:hypothetical protein AAZX31_09G241300 [Glycine max]|nr:(+)-neomenthol dehydrogenase [Glycine soja]